MLAKKKISPKIQTLVNQLFTERPVSGRESRNPGLKSGSASSSSSFDDDHDTTRDSLGDRDGGDDNDFRVPDNNNLVSDNDRFLFQCLIVVGLDRDPETRIYRPYIKEKFPVKTELPTGVEQLCFPDSHEWPYHEGETAQFYTLTITDDRGCRKFGFCYRILSEGLPFCFPIAYCIISSHRAIGFYREVLREITSRHGEPKWHDWLGKLFANPFPKPGESVIIQERFATTTFRRSPDHRLDECELDTLLSTIDLKIVLKLFACLLCERKIVLTSRSLCKVSLCVEALESMLYPFSWQHTFIPILPLDMVDVLDAPAPFLIGILCSSQSPWNNTLEEGIVVDLDKNKVISCVGDEDGLLPKRIREQLLDAFQTVLKFSKKSPSVYPKHVLISECFIRMFVVTLGHHADHAVGQFNGDRVFLKYSFLSCPESKEVQAFLESFCDTSMFTHFTGIRLENPFPPQFNLFDQRVKEETENSHHGLIPLHLSKPCKKANRSMSTWFFGE